MTSLCRLTPTFTKSTFFHLRNIIKPKSFKCGPTDLQSLSHCNALFSHLINLPLIICSQFRILLQDYLLGQIDRLSSLFNSYIFISSLLCVGFSKILTCTYRALHGQAPAYTSPSLISSLSQVKEGKFTVHFTRPPKGLW